MNDSDEEKYFEEDGNEEEKINSDVKNRDSSKEEEIDTLEEFMLEINKFMEKRRKKKKRRRFRIM
ncbi:hypothetical protein PFMC_00600 [Plasmodium falciparum CAMP/Malaysia]|uniref:Uncharacterized protein n=1 Tax=Plasmodium falciparum (isolate Camp / Malaysia) TaxID=5835 RepID=A0A024XEB2_PLAFC|nr:hypothetical protein PFMC_00600 [Plasmodium falciparum CAMP/Malaysia]